MAICSKCGRTVTEGKKFCTACGAPVKKRTQKTRRTAAHTAGSGAVMSVGNYVLSTILMCLPVAGLIIGIIWALGGCDNINKRNYARALLIFMAAGLVLSLLIIIISGFAFSSLIDLIKAEW